MKILHKDFHAYSSNEPILSFFLELLPASHYVFDKYNNFDPAILWHECKSFPYVEGDGMYTGTDEIVQHIFMNIPKHFDGFTISVTDIFLFW